MANIDVSHLTSAATLAGLSVDKKGVVTGSGVFDNLMEAVNVHLDAQYNSGRLTGKDYASVYLGALQSTIQQSIAFILGEQTADKQAELLTKQASTEDRKALDIASTTTVRNAQSTNDTALKAAQTSVATNQAATELIKAINIAEDTIVKDAQAALIVKQTLTEVNKATDVGSSTSVRNVQSTKDSAIKDAQVAKLGAEKKVLNQKEVTEYSQTEKISVGFPATDNSILGRQSTLYEEQAKGFKWNADQKYLKTIMDGWAVNIASADGTGAGVTAINTTTTGSNDLNVLIDGAKPA
jgi:hypothetical protein